MGKRTAKIKLIVSGDSKEKDRVYDYLRNGMEIQSQMMNMYMVALYTAFRNGADKEELDELDKQYSRIPSSSRGSAYLDLDMSKYPTGLPIAGNIPHIVKPIFITALKKGLMYGNTSLPSFKKGQPLYVAKRFCGILGTVIPLKEGKSRTCNTGWYHDYDSYADFYHALMHDSKVKLHLKFANDILFDVELGKNINRSMNLRTDIDRCFTGEYKICESEICVKESDIFISLTLDIPDKNLDDLLDENTVVGIDCGYNVPAVCALNNNALIRCFIGYKDNFVEQRKKIQSQYRRIQSNLVYAKGGHGRKKKMRTLDRYKSYERNFAKTYNHYVSNKVVEFALENHAKYINLEDLSGFGNDEKNKMVLRNWSYYELQSMIKYKAASHGIIVRMIKPAYTSQTCSICGKRGERPTQAEFICTDPACRIHGMYKSEKFKDSDIHADFNAARNIAQSTQFVEKMIGTVTLEFAKSIDGLITKSEKPEKGKTKKKGEEVKYDQCIVYKPVRNREPKIEIMCDDGFWHTFSVSEIKDSLSEGSNKRVTGMLRRYTSKVEQKQGSEELIA